MGSGPVSKSPVNDVQRSVVWLDASIRSADKSIKAQQLLRTSINQLKNFTNDDECERYIRSIPRDHRLILIVDSKLGRLIIPRIHQLIQVSAIFVHSMNKTNEKWTAKYKKIKGVIEDMDQLINQVLSAEEKQTGRDRFEEPLLITIYNTTGSSGHSTKELNDQFVQSQKLIYSLIRTKSTVNDINEFITYCKREYANNSQQLNIIREFQLDYSADSALQWYTRDCFLYKSLTKALRMQNIDVLNLFGFFIRDLHQQLKRSQYLKFVHLYRGQLMPKAEVHQLQHSIGQLISINSFLSTTVDRETAIIFSGANEAASFNYQPVLFVIEADPRLMGIKPFADITTYSYMANEKEVLMMLGSIFRLVDINHDGTLCVIRLVLCSENDSDLRMVLGQMKFDNQGKGNTNSGASVSVVASQEMVDDVDEPIRSEINSPSSIRNVKKPSAFKPNARFKSLANLHSSRETKNSSVNSFQRPAPIVQKTLKADDPGITAMHHDNGRTYYATGEYKQAIQSYNKALSINRQAFDEDHTKVAESFTNVGILYMKDRQYPEALNYLQKALEIRMKHLHRNHLLLGESHKNIASAYCGLRKYNSALEHYNIALQIYESCLPPPIHRIAVVYNGIGTVHAAKRNFQLALQYYERAADMFHQTTPDNHPDVIDLQRNIDEARNVLRLK